MIIYQLSEFSTNIKKVESERQTNNSVFISGNRHAWISNYHQHYTSFDEAKSKLLERLKKQLERNEAMVKMGKEYIQSLENTKESDL